VAGEDKKPARFVPWALLSPGGLWLALFFLLPLWALIKMSFSTSETRFSEPELTWSGSNFSQAFSDYGAQFGRSFLYAGLATLFAIIIGYPLAYFIAAYGGKWSSGNIKYVLDQESKDLK
jgi:spermidine/putrescine transport system permease protein